MPFEFTFNINIKQILLLGADVNKERPQSGRWGICPVETFFGQWGYQFFAILYERLKWTATYS